MELAKLTLLQAKKGLENKEFSSLELTEACIKNAEKNKRLNAFITETFDYARDRAKLSDKKIAENKNIGKLEGIPLAIKDLFCTNGIRTTAGSRMLENFVPPYESTVTKKLLNKYGLKTLAKGEKGYIDVYEGDAFKRDSSYHQGITWPWLLGLYYNTLKNKIEFEKTKTKKKELEQQKLKFEEDVRKTFVKEFYERGTIGTIAEIYDSKTPNLPKGTMAQAWSVAEIFRIIKDYFIE